MKKQILLFALSLAFYFASGQCGPYTITVNNPSCTSNTLRIPGASAATQIVWSYSGSIYSQATRGALTGSITTAAGGHGYGSASNQLFSPSGVFADGSGNIYIADKINFRIQKFLAGGTTGVTVAGGNGQGSGADHLWDPFDIFVDSAGNVYIADFGNNRIQKFPPGSTSTTSGVTIAGGNGAGGAANQLNGPVSVYVDHSGNVYVADLNNNRIQKFPAGSTSATNGTTVAGGGHFNSPDGVYLDAAGNIYVTDGGSNRVVKFPPNSTSATIGITVAGGNGSGSAANQLNSPMDLYVDSAGDIYVTDLYNHRIQKFPAGSTSATNGITVAGGNGSGSAFDQLDQPYSVFVDSSGYIYIADEHNNRIQRWSQPAVVGIDTTLTVYSRGDYSARVVNSAGCANYSDTVSVNHLNYTDSTYTDQYICPGSTYNLGGHILSSTGLYQDTIITSWGCDSIISLYLTVFPIVQSYALSICQGSTYSFGGHILSATGVYHDTLVSVLGCDSMISTLSLTVVPGGGPYTLSIPNCSHTLNVSGASAAKKIVWKHNGVSIDSVSRGLIGPLSIVAGGNGQGTAANQIQPQDLFIDGAGNIYVTDYHNGNNCIKKFPAGSTSATMGVIVAGGNGSGSGANQFNTANGLYVDGAGNIYVADGNNNRIQKFPAGSTSATNGITIAGGNGSGSAANQLNHPYSVCLDAAGNVYVTDQGNYRIQKFPAGSTSATNATTVAGGHGIGSDSIHLSATSGMCLDNSNNIYVCDWGNNRVQRFPAGSTSATGGTTVAKGTGLNRLYSPISVHLDSSGYIYVADQGMARVRKFPPGSTDTTTGVIVAGANGRGDAIYQFNFLQGMYLDSAANIYVSDNGNYSIKKWEQPAVIGIDTSFYMSFVGTYSVQVTSSSVCSASSDTIGFSAYASSISQSICSGSSYTFGGHSLTISGTYYDTVTTGSGCDSITTLTLTVGTNIYSNRSQTICYGGSYTFGGHILTIPGTYYDTLTSSHGCDSITILTFIVNPVLYNYRAQSICQGSTYSFGGHSLTTAGVYYDTLTSSNGCDSIIMLTLAVNPNSISSQAQSICQGSIYSFGGHTLTAAGVYHDTLTSANGCDSIITLTLTVNSNAGSSQAQNICQGSVFSFGGHNLTAAGVYYDTLNAANTCDSIVTLHLTVDSIVAHFTLQPSGTAHLWYIVNQCTGAGLTYVWNWGDGNTSTGDTPSHIYSAVGYYDVCVNATDSMGCTALYCDSNAYLYKDQAQMVSVNVVFQVPTGINTVTSERPDIIYRADAIHFSEPIVLPSRLRLYDLSGKVVMSQDNFMGNVWNINSGLAQGAYIIHMENDSYSLSRKIMITQ